jgi:hypothetical protein
MISVRRGATAAAILFLATTASVSVAAQIDSPTYKAWARFKVGSSETLGYTVESGGMKMEMESTSTLKEVADDQVTIALQGTMNMMGQKRTIPARTLTIPAKADQKDVKELGEENVEAAGQTFQCKVIEAKVDQPGPGGKPVHAEAKMWISPKVPGGVVKTESASHGGPETNGKVTSLLKSFDAK